METVAELERRFAKLDDLAEVLHAVRRWASSLGVVRQSYHFSPIFDGPTSPRTVVYAEGFSDAWVERYEQFDFRGNDPIPIYAFEQARMVYWSEAIEACAEREGAASYAAAMKEFGLIHGFGLPLYGPRGRNAYASFDFDRLMTDDDAPMILRVRTVAQMAHQRVCVLLEAERDTTNLSERETEVLQWLVRGKSNTDIATILDISPETVRTYTQRIYAKLGAVDRVGAVVKALKHRLVAP